MVGTGSLYFSMKSLSLLETVNLEKHPNLLIIAGTGRNSGKTTVACTLISRFMHLEVTAIKISPHEHNLMEGAELLHRGSSFSIYSDRVAGVGKDTSRMLTAGASKAYYINADDSSVREAFGWLISRLESTRPVICESPLLRRYITPGLFIIADSNLVEKRKDMAEISGLEDMTVHLDSTTDVTATISFSDGRWHITSG